MNKNQRHLCSLLLPLVELHQFWQIHGNQTELNLNQVAWTIAKTCFIDKGLLTTDEVIAVFDKIGELK